MSMFKASLELFGDMKVARLFKHVGKVEEGDSYQAVVDKVSEGIWKITDQALARFKLLNQMQEHKSMIVE